VVIILRINKGQYKVVRDEPEKLLVGVTDIPTDELGCESPNLHPKYPI
jgi:hypothetical protein